MTGSRAAQVLEQEHRIIQRVVASMSAMAADLRAGRAVEPQDLRDAVAFLREFADQRHHAKEEKYLFPLLEARGVPPGGCPIGVLKHEHEKGRALVAALSTAIEEYAGRSDPESLIAALTGLVELYPGHIWKEDYLLIPMAGKVLSGPDEEALAKQFEGVDAETGPDVHGKFEELAARLERRAHHA